VNEIQRLLHEPVVFRLGLTLVHFLWQGVVFGLLALLVLATLRQARPATRYLALLVLFAAMAACPVVTYSLTRREPKPMIITKAAMARLLAESAKVRSLSREASAPTQAREPLSHVARVKLLRGWRWVRLRLPVGVMLWCAGVLALALRLLLRWRALTRIKGRATLIEGGAPAKLLVMVANRLKVRRAVRLLQSALVQVPTVIGWLRPVILLPPCALTGLTPLQLQAVIAHEVAHIRRHDFLVNLLQTVVETLLFHHPVVWWLSHCIRTEREQCCDDLAVMVCGDALSYARALAELEQLRGKVPEPAVAAAGGPLTSRVRRLVASGSNTRPLAPWLSAAIPALAVAFFLLAPALTRIAGASSLEGTLVYVNGRNTRVEGQVDYVTRVLRGGAEWVMPEAGPRQYPWSDDFSPATGEVIYSYGSCRDDKGIWKANPDGSDPVELTRVEGVGGVNCWPKWSPDGTKIIFDHMAPLPGQQPSRTPIYLWVMNTDGSEAHPVTDFPSHGGSWAPDSSRLLACTCPKAESEGGKPGQGHPIMTDLRGEQVQVMPSSVGGGAVWSPDGLTIATPSQVDATMDGKPGKWHQIVLTDLRNNRVRTLARFFVSWDDARAYHPGEKDWAATAMWTIGPHHLTWSPSGSKIAFLAAMPYRPSLTKGLTDAMHHVNDQWDVFVCDVRTGQVKRITDDAVCQEKHHVAGVSRRALDPKPPTGTDRGGAR